MDDCFHRYRCRYVFSFRFGKPHRSYELVGAKGGLHLHINDYGEEHGQKYGNRYGAGLEIHYRVPPAYMADRPPSHDECWLLKCPCWHDGTTQYAEERYMPMFERGVEPEAMLRLLCNEADERFGVKRDDGDTRPATEAA